MANFTTGAGPFGFPAEFLLTEHPPDYPRERINVIIYLVAVFLFFSVFVPTLFAEVAKEENTETKAPQEPPVQESTTTSTKKSAKKSVKRMKKEAAPSSKAVVVPEKEETPPPVVVYEIRAAVTLQCCLACMFFLAWILLKLSPDNYYTTRGVFQAPVLTREECQTILKMADVAADISYKEAKSVEAMYNLLPPSEGEDEDDAAERQLDDTVKGLLQEPVGWQKFRHGNYPTTDLNIVTDPFTKEDRAFIKEKLDARLSPILQRIWGIPPSAIRANDMFVVRYDDGKRTHLTNHTDDASISFNILLDDDFEGGGTQFWNRLMEAPFAHVNPTQVGQGLMHSARINHEGMHVSRGTRTILVGFLSVDRIDPLVEDHVQSTGLSWFASWGSLNWGTVKFKEGYHAAYTRLGFRQDSWKNHRLVRSFFLDVFSTFNNLGDLFFPHFVSNLVDDKDRETYLASLDAQYQKGDDTPPQEGGVANWFRGQQINVDVTGEKTSDWGTRAAHEHRFMELEL